MKIPEITKMKKREVLNAKKSVSSFARSAPVTGLVSRKVSTSNNAAANLSSGSTSKSSDPVEQDPEVEIDIYYSQYLQAKFMEKLMTEGKTEVESIITSQFASILDPKAVLENPKVTVIKNYTDEVKQLGAEYTKLSELKHQLETLEHSDG